jgi:hypothetical protein
MVFHQMEIFDEEDEEIKELMRRISRKEITLCSGCDAFFDYIPNKLTCDECNEAKKREYDQRPEVKERVRERQREYGQRPEVKERVRERQREYRQRPEAKKRKREYDRERYQRPELRERRRKYMREYYQRKKQLREEE